MKTPLEEIRSLGLTIDISEDSARKLWGVLLEIDGKFRDSTSSDDGIQTIRDSYHAIARAIVSGATSDDILTSMIPDAVFALHERFRWRQHNRATTTAILSGSVTRWQGKRLQMESGRPSLPASDPRTKLSGAARDRLARIGAGADVEILRAKALIADEFMGDEEKAYSILRKALVKAAEVNMEAVSKEFSALGLPDKEYRAIMRNEIEAITYSYELNQAYAQMLTSKFLYQHAGPAISPQQVAAPIHSQRISPPERKRQPSTVTSMVAAQLTLSFIQAKGLTQKQFCGRAGGMSDKTLRSFIKTGTVRKGLLVEIAKAMKTDTESLLSGVTPPVTKR